MHASSPSSWSPSQRGDTANSSYSGSKGQNFSRPPRREEFKAYVKNVPSHITKESLEAFFQSCGTVVSCHVLEPKEGRNSTVGFVGFSSEEEVNNAIQTMNGTTLEGSQLAVERAIQRDRGAGTPMRGQENQYQGPKTGFQHSAGGEEFKAYVKNVPAHITKESLEAFFQSCGTVVSCHVMEPKEGRNSTVGFVGFSSEEEVNNAIQTMNGTSLESNQLTVERAIQRDRGTGTPMRGQENRYQGPRTDFQHSAAGFQNGQPSHQGYRPKQYEQPHNYTQQPGGVKVEQAIFNPRGPGRGIPMQSPGPNPVPGRDSNYVNGVPNEYSNNTQGPANPASWSDQGPQQWDQTNSVNNQQMSGRLPYNTMPQEPYTQQEQKPRFQGGGQSCHKCGEVGHFARDCPTQGEQGGRGGQSCHKCGEVGHFARDCPTQGEQGGRGGQNCHKCGEVGHFARDCPTQGEQRGRGDQSCFKCGETGHFSRECTSSGVLDKTCRKCGEEGHFARECPAVGNATSPGQKGDQSCFKCGETGHFSRECPSSEGTENRVPPVTYIPPELPNVDELFQDAPHSGLNFDKYDDIPVQVTGKDPVPPISTFEEAGILEQCSANIKKAQFIKPTPIQKYAIPITLQGRDLMACAQTGSGKTVAFLVPVLTTMIKQGHLSGGFLTGETQAPTALCIAPTRELAIQIYKEVCKFSNGTVVTAAVCYGGVSVQHQLDKLRRGCHILVATPGRLHDFVGRNRVSLANVRYLILDEADRMLDMGFEPEIRKLVERCGMPDKTNRQTLMFSATFPDEIQRLAADFLKEDYLFVAVGRIGGSNLDITQTVISVPGDDKQEKLFEILLNSGTDRTLIFVELKRVADFLACLLSQNNFPTTSISGDRTQQEREAALRDFRSGRAPVLVATSVAARGLDIPDVKHVINFDLPQDIEEYVHRIGRTGRIGNKGRATSFFQPGKDERLARSLVKVLSEAYQEVPEWLEQVAEEAIGSSYGPAGGKFASKDRRERDHSRPSYSADVMGGVNRGMARLDVNAHSQPRPSPSHNSNSAAAEDEEEWD
ncbi:uncharacterized protein LOC144638600 isoform X11 [Oculina patagonica]